MRTNAFTKLIVCISLIAGCGGSDDVIPPPGSSEDWGFPANATKFAISLYSDKSTVSVGESFDVKMVLYNIPNVFGSAVEVGYPGDKVSITQTLAGPHFSPQVWTIAISRVDSLQNRASYGVTYIAGSNRTSSGSGAVMKFRCTAKASGAVQFSINPGILEIRKADGSLINNFPGLQIEGLTITVL